MTVTTRQMYVQVSVVLPIFILYKTYFLMVTKQVQISNVVPTEQGCQLLSSAWSEIFLGGGGWGFDLNIN